MAVKKLRHQKTRERCVHLSAPPKTTTPNGPSRTHHRSPRPVRPSIPSPDRPSLISIRPTGHPTSTVPYTFPCTSNNLDTVHATSYEPGLSLGILEPLLTRLNTTPLALACEKPSPAPLFSIHCYFWPSCHLPDQCQQLACFFDSF